MMKKSKLFVVCSSACVVSMLFALCARSTSSMVGASEAKSQRTEAGPSTGLVKPLVIAHRGASGYRPEHTLAAYELAIDLGADYIEPDLVPTKDGHLVTRHENEISGTTDVANHSEFADRKKTKRIDGKDILGWFTEDFTLAELKSLRARERMPAVRQRNTIYDNRYQIPEFDDVINLVKRKEAQLHRRIGLYPEAKHPSYFARINLPTEQTIVDTLKRHGYEKSSDPVYIQCFETATLQKLKTMTKLKLVQLVADDELPYDLVARNDKRKIADLINPEGLAAIARYAHGVGPNKNLIVGRSADGKLLKPTTLVADAHKAGLEVHPWTFRNENQFLPQDFRKVDSAEKGADNLYGNALAEYKMFYDLDVDGVFSENPDTAVEARTEMQLRR